MPSNPGDMTLAQAMAAGQAREQFVYFYRQLAHDDTHLEALLGEFADRSNEEQAQIADLAYQCVPALVAFKDYFECETDHTTRVQKALSEDQRVASGVRASVIVDRYRYIRKILAWKSEIASVHNLMRTHEEQRDEEGGWDLYAKDFATRLTMIVNKLSKARGLALQHADQLEKAFKKLKDLPYNDLRKVPHPDPWKAVGNRQRKVLSEQEPLSHYVGLLSGTWKYARPLGGGMAVAALWVWTGPDGVISKRIVRKDTHFTPSELGKANWFDGALPREWLCQKRVQSQPDAMNFVTAFNYEVHFAEPFHFRLYTGFCPGGDLGHLHDRARKQRAPVSIPFVWMVLEKLVECGIIMERGQLTGEPLAGWKELVHRDLKPGNVFLDDLRDGDWPCYAQPRLGDWGLAVETSRDDPRNPWIFHGSGTPGYYTPEHGRYIDRGDGHPVDNFPFLAHTNVWGVGAIIWCMLHQREMLDTDQPDYWWAKPGSKFTPDIAPAVRTAEPGLASVVGECLKFNPSERPTFHQLRDWVQRNMPPRVQTLKAGVADPQTVEVLYGLPGDNYKIGMAFPPK